LALADYFLDHFTTDYKDKSVWIEVIKKYQIKDKLKEGAVIIYPTGWCNELICKTDERFYVFFSQFIQF
jgi:hypothetical protein